MLSATLPRNEIVGLGGPSFATEVALGLPTCVVLASTSPSAAAAAARAFHGDRFRCFTSRDVVGVELGASLKNVYAIAVGVSDGVGMGANARAVSVDANHLCAPRTPPRKNKPPTPPKTLPKQALITRGLNEMTRLVVAKGGSPLTMLCVCKPPPPRRKRAPIPRARGPTLRAIPSPRRPLPRTARNTFTPPPPPTPPPTPIFCCRGLGGLGDLVLTCTGDLSRNRRVGLAMGRGATRDEALAALSGQVAEGVASARTGWALAHRLGLAAPILGNVYALLHEGKPVEHAVRDLLSQDMRGEWD